MSVEIRKKVCKISVNAEEEARWRREDIMAEVRKKMCAGYDSDYAQKLQQFNLSQYNLIQHQNALAENAAEFGGDNSEVDEHDLEVKLMVGGMYCGDDIGELLTLSKIRQWLSVDNPPVDELIDTIELIPRFIQLLGRHDNHQLQYEAAWALTVVASGTSAHTAAVVKQGVVPMLVKLLSSPAGFIREQAAWALGTIAGDSPLCRNLVLAHGALMPLLAQLTINADVSMLKTGSWTLSNLCHGKPSPSFERVSPALPVLSHLIHFYDDEVLKNTCWTLAYISDGTNDKIQAVIESGFCKWLVHLLSHRSHNVLVPALLTVGNIATGDDIQTQVLIDNKVLPRLQNLLTQSHKKIIKVACWTISNITAGDEDQIQAVIEADIVPQLIQLLKDAEYDIKKEAVCAIFNATSGGSLEQIRFLVSQGCIKPLCDLLICPDPNVVSVCLGGLENILKAGESDKESDLNGGINIFAQMIDDLEGFDNVENLRNHENNEICEEAAEILEKYRVKEKEEQNLAEDIGGSQEGFAVDDNQPNVPSEGFNQDCNIKPLCDLLICPDPRIVIVCLEALENILKVGESDKVNGLNGGVNIYGRILIDDLDGFDKIVNLRSHKDNEISEKAVKILEYCGNQ